MTQRAAALNHLQQTEASTASDERLQARSDGTQWRRTILTEAVQQAVIPRLLERRGPPSPGQPQVSELHIAELADLLLHADGSSAIAFVTALLEQGFAAEALYLD
ncbi:MAG: hypothetical protein M3N26_01460, partial [Pseudomonadota bacterium]|nr:hypothetical protein [Pseudomonadota bacterium]